MDGPPPRFLPDQLTVSAGDVVFLLVNTSANELGQFMRHTMAIGPDQGQPPVAISKRVVQGTSAAFTVPGLEAGEYVFWCTIQVHSSEGMVGTLKVED